VDALVAAADWVNISQKLFEAPARCSYDGDVTALTITTGRVLLLLGIVIASGILMQIAEGVSGRWDQTNGKRRPADDLNYPNWTESEVKLWHNRPRRPTDWERKKLRELQARWDASPPGQAERATREARAHEHLVYGSGRLSAADQALRAEVEDQNRLWPR
jgi:hypothetical protein